MKARIAVNLLGAAAVALLMIAFANSPRRVSSVAAVEKLYAQGYRGKVRLEGYCLAGTWRDTFADASPIGHYVERPLAMDVSGLFQTFPAARRREARIAMMLAQEGRRAAVTGRLQEYLSDPPVVRKWLLLQVERIDDLEPVSVNKPPSFRLPVACVYGHATLKHVEIIYGRPGKKNERQRRAEAEHEILFAGTCIVSANSPQWTAYCTTCGFTGGEVGWAREADDVAAFVQPFSSLLQTFPKPERPRTPRYSQHVVAGIIRLEQFAFVTSEPAAVVEDGIRKWAAEHGLALDRSARVSADGALRLVTQGLNTFLYWGQADSALVGGDIHILEDATAGTVWVDVSIRLKSPDAKSIDSALAAARGR